MIDIGNLIYQFGIELATFPKGFVAVASISAALFFLFGLGVGKKLNRPITKKTITKEEETPFEKRKAPQPAPRPREKENNPMFTAPKNNT
jgi:hypothetical protein